MALFDLPSASTVRLESRLRPEQVTPTMASEAALETDIGTRITEEAAVIETRILEAASPFGWPFSDTVLAEAYPDYTSTQLADETTRQKALATLATEHMALASLYYTAGQLHEAYRVQAEQYVARAERVMMALLALVRFISGRQDLTVPNTSFAVQLGRNDGYSIYADENA